MSQRLALLGLFLLVHPLIAKAQAPTASPPARAASPEHVETKPAIDHRAKPFVIESYYTVARFENDGTGEREISARVRVNSEAGAQQFRELVFAYDSGGERVDVRSIHVHKAGGEVNGLTVNAIKETPAAATREAPAYASYKEKHVVVSSLQAGDVLEYRVATVVVKPAAPGQFWFQYNFLQDAAVLDERLELNLPQGRAYSIKSPGFDRIAGKESRPAPVAPFKASDFAFTTTNENGRTVLRWQHTNTRRTAEESQQAPRDQRARVPDVQLTSFESWDAVAQWFAQTEKSHSQPNPAIRAKAQQLIHGATSKTEKMRALCEYVSKKIRTINVPFDLTQLPPRSAADVLAAGYGDSEEKHFLLAAMLDTAGIRSNAALIPFAREFDKELPSPMQFDRVLTAVPENGKFMWMDSTAELAPFRYLPAALRDKSGLLVSASGRKIVETPADPPFVSMQRVEIESKISELGKLSGNIHYSLRGDAEFLLRGAFHRIPHGQWNQLAQTILTLNGLRAEVVDVTTSDPSATEKPFVLNIQFTELNALDWPSKKARIALPLLTIPTPDAPAESDQAVKLGTPVAVSTHLKLSLPANFMVQPPVGVAVTRDYAEYKSSYRFENGTLIAERSLSFNARELPASRSADYLAFTHAVKADEAQTLVVEDPAASLSAIPAGASADDVFEAGAAALKSDNTQTAIPLLKRATELQPKHKQAWNVLGLAYMQAGKFEDAAAAFRKQIEVNPSDEHANDCLGLALDRLQRDDEAALAFRKQIEAYPLDTIAHAALGSILLDQHKYPEAVAELEKGAILAPDNARVRVSLGRAYLNTGENSKALDSFQKAIEIEPTPAMRNDVAFSLAEKGIELDKAQEYVESAIKATAADLQKLSLSQVQPDDFAEVSSIGDYWDTLGWIYFQRGDLAKAQSYIRAAWRLNQRGEVGDHFAQVYEKLGEKQVAVHQYAVALAAPHSVAETRARLMLLLGGNSEIDDLVKKARPDLENDRTFEIKEGTQIEKEDASADLLILMTPYGSEGRSTKAEDVAFVKGSESLRAAVDQLRTIDFGTVFPDASPVKLVRRGKVTCSRGGCKLSLSLPEDAIRRGDVSR